MSTLLLAAAFALPASAQDSAHVIQTGAAVIDGPLDPAALQAGLERRQKAIDRCYAPALVEDPDLFGLVRVGLTVDQAGEVTKAALVEHTLASDAVAECIAGVLQVVPLSPLQGGDSAEVSTTVVLLPAPPIVPRKKLMNTLSACAVGTETDAATRPAVARLVLDGGRATEVQLGALAPLNPQAVACLDQALELGPHKVATAVRYYRWDLP